MWTIKPKETEIGRKAPMMPSMERALQVYRENQLMIGLCCALQTHRQGKGHQAISHIAPSLLGRWQVMFPFH